MPSNRPYTNTQTHTHNDISEKDPTRFVLQTIGQLQHVPDTIESSSLQLGPSTTQRMLPRTSGPQESSMENYMYFHWYDVKARNPGFTCQ